LPTVPLYNITSGDFNGDGISDIISVNSYSFDHRAAYIYLGNVPFNGVPDALIDGFDDLSGWGNEISVGDVNGDGRDEALISAPNIWWYQGRAYLFTGPETWIDYGDTVAVAPGELQRHPGWCHLAQNYPNPFNASTTVHFDVGKPSTISLTVYDLTGQRIKTLLAKKALTPGGYNVSWMGKNDHGAPVASGMYLLEMGVDQYRQTKKMILLK
ncbi:MAG: T9SS C-terminal target domain-containing protein, partial [Candidatus Zixiibacteriota bacterium]